MLRLSIPRPRPPFVKRSALFVLAAFLCTPLAYPDTYRLPLFVAETDSGQTGMLRINNDSTSSGTVSIHAINDAGTMSNRATLTLAGNATVELSVDELASGSAAKQLTGGVGTINAHVRLEIDTELDIDVLAYLRDSSGVLTVLHDDVRPDSGSGDDFQYQVPIFHATGSGSMAASSLRLVNAGSEAARITVRDRTATNASVTLTLAAGTARTLTATELEGGAAGLTGQIGMNAGDWRLTVSSDQPIEVVNLATLANRLENLSSSGEQGLAPLDHGLFHHRFVDGTLSTRQGSTRTEFEIMAANAFEEMRQAATGNARKGTYAYRRSSEDAGELSLSYADGNSCTMNLHFTSRDSGWYATRCDSGEMENGMWHGGSWSAELADTSLIATDGFRFPSRSLSRNYSLGRAIATWQLPAAIGGSGMEVYSVTGDVPAGLMFDAATRQFTGTPTTAGMYRLTYTVTDSSSDTATMSLRITVTGGEAGTCTLGLTLRAGQSCVYPGSTEALTVSADGSTVTFLVITSQRGINVPNRTWRGQVVDLRVRPGVEPGTWRIVRLMGEEAPPPDTKPRFGSASIDSQNYIINQAIPALTLPRATGGNGRLIYSLTPAVPGLRFSAASRRLTGAPTSIGARNMTYTVEDQDGDEVSLNFTITVRRTDKPDLTVSSLQASDTTLTPEQSVTLTARVRNDGGTGVAQATAQVYVSEDMTLSPSDDKNVGRRDAGRVDADANQAVEFRVTAESAEGTYYYFVCADTVAGEEDTTNNCSTGERVVVRSRTAGPDLVVSSISASESSVRAGDSFRLTATVRNQGEAQSPSTRVRYVQSSDATITPGDSQRGDDRLQGLAPSSNGVENDSVRAPETPGTYYFGACVVPVEGEENTANNCSQVIRITVTRRQSSGSTRPTPRPDPVPTQGPDLVVENARVSKSTPDAGGSFDLTVRVRNRGNQPSSATMVRFYRSADSRITAGDTSVGSPMGVIEIDNSKVSGDITANLTAPSAPGTYYYGACVDLVVNELNTGNQCSNGARIQVAATGAHLQVTLSVSNSRPRPKQSFTLTATVRNIGSAQANSTTLTFNKSRNADGSSYEVLEGYTDGQIGALNANRSVSKRFTYTVPEEDTGTWYYRACVEINNCSPGVKVTVPGIDLIVDQAKVDDSSPEVGDRFELSVRIRNQGITDAPSAMLTYYRSTDATITTGDDSVGSESVKSLDRGESDEEDIRLTLTSTELRTQRFYYFGACVEVANDVDNTNNCSEGVLVTVGAPDLIVDSPRLDDPTPEAGERFRLTVRVRNIGHVESPATTLSFHRYQSDTNKMRINEQMLPGTERVGSLRINEQSDETGRLTAPTTPGEYWFYACVPKNIPNESNTGNNCSKPIKVMVPAPDLTVARPTADDTTPQAGESFTLTARVRNIGRGPAESAMVRFCSSTDGKAATLTLANCSPGFDTERVTGLDPSESDEVDVTLNANNMPGRYYYYACVVTVAGESKTDNNCSSSALQITVPAPDLVVVSPSVNDPTLAPGDRFKFRATVRNQGRGTAGAATLTYYEARQTDFSDPVAVGTADSIGSLSPSESSRQEADLTANIAGTYYYRACVTQLATESNDKNNCSSRVTVTVRDP